jgi:hypothetical protein
LYFLLPAYSFSGRRTIKYIYADSVGESVA